MNRDLQNIRQDYTMKDLNETEVDKNPIVQFSIWLDEYKEVCKNDLNTMVLSTADASGKPSSRIVLLKGYSEKGFEFFTNYDSQKGQEIKNNDKVCLLFFWPELERQIKIDGIAQKLSAEESDAYFSSRPKDSRVGAWASPQSQEITSREQLENKVDEMAESKGEALERPPHWGGYKVIANGMEFWQGRANRLHDRLYYQQGEDNWSLKRLAP